VILEADQHRLAVLGVDPRAGEGAVETVDRARRQVPNGSGGIGLARRVEETVGFPPASIAFTFDVVKDFGRTSRSNL
jgi:hypothetical protein